MMSDSRQIAEELAEYIVAGFVRNRDHIETRGELVDAIEAKIASIVARAEAAEAEALEDEITSLRASRLAAIVGRLNSGVELQMMAKRNNTLIAERDRLREYAAWVGTQNEELAYVELQGAKRC